MWSNRWHVQLGEGGRRMTQSQMEAAAGRRWIDAETPVKKPHTSRWTKLGDAMPNPKRPVDGKGKDVETSAMIVLSGEIEIVSEEDETKLTYEGPTRLADDELASARPPKGSGKLLVLGAMLFAASAFLSYRYVPSVGTMARSMITDLRPATLPTQTPATTAPPQSFPSTPIAPMAIASTSIAPGTITHVPKMRAPTPPPPVASAKAAPVKTTTTKARAAQPKKPAIRAKR